MGRQRKVFGILLQVAAVVAALLLAIWLVAMIGVARTYGVPLTDAQGLLYLWSLFWVPFHLLAAGFLAGRLMCRSLPDRTLSSDIFR